MPLSETKNQRLLFRWSLGLYLALSAGLLVALRGEAGTAGLVSLGTYVVTSVLALGKFVIFLGLGEDARFGPWTLALIVFLLDLAFAFLLALGIERLEHVPGLGRWLRRSRRRAGRVLCEYPGLERMAFLGVAAFVMLPLAATGAISGSFAARLVGLSRIAGIAAIAIGAAGTAVSFALLASFLGARAEALARSPALMGVSILLLVIAARVAYLRVTSELKRERFESEETHP